MSAKGTLGNIEEFDGSKDDWSQYVERLEHFFYANEITDADKKRAVFLSVVGAATYQSIRKRASGFLIWKVLFACGKEPEVHTSTWK